MQRPPRGAAAPQSCHASQSCSEGGSPSPAFPEAPLSLASVVEATAPLPTKHASWASLQSPGSSGPRAAAPRKEPGPPVPPQSPHRGQLEGYCVCVGGWKGPWEEYHQGRLGDSFLLLGPDLAPAEAKMRSPDTAQIDRVQDDGGGAEVVHFLRTGRTG